MSYDVYWVKNRAEKIADFEHPTLQGAWFVFVRYPGRCPGLWRNWAFSPHYLRFDTPSKRIKQPNAPCKGNSNIPFVFRVALTGRIVRNCLIPRAMPWAVESCPFGACWRF